MLATEPITGTMIFSENYPQYPSSVGLRDDPSVAVKERFYSVDDTITSESDYSSFNSSSRSDGEDGGEKMTEAADNSYI